MNNASKNFLWSELTCKCGCGTKNISPAAIAKLQAMRDLVGPLVILSAARCLKHNKKVGGASKSQHISTDTKQSTAFDVAFGSYTTSSLIAAATTVGFNGIGVYPTFIHVDDRATKARW
jgi:uncharacterized protein YcbK (DUF882 family)